MKKTFIVMVMALGALLLNPAIAAGADFECTGFQSGGTFGNVVVPTGQSCVLDHVRVTGKVTVQTGGNLIVSTTGGDSTVAGDIKGDGCGFIELEATSLAARIVVGGNVRIQNCTGVVFSGGQGDSTRTPPGSILIGGNVKCSDNADGCVFDYFIISGSLECSANGQGCTVNHDAIGGSVTMNNNPGGVIVTESAIGGDLKCSGNASATSNPPNTIAGTSSGQCSGF